MGIAELRSALTGLSMDTGSWSWSSGELEAIFDANLTGFDSEGSLSSAGFNWALRWLGDHESELELHLGEDFLTVWQSGSL